MAERARNAVRQRLPDAGERPSAAHGWNGVGSRTLAAKADVTPSALNYHFGGKENLLAEIFAARAAPIAAERLRPVVQAREAASLEAVIEALLLPALAGEAQFDGEVFAKLRARLATEPEAFSRRILSKASVLRRLHRGVGGDAAGPVLGGPRLALPVRRHGRPRPHPVADRGRVRPGRH